MSLLLLSATSSSGEPGDDDDAAAAEADPETPDAEGDIESEAGEALEEETELGSTVHESLAVTWTRSEYPWVAGLLRSVRTTESVDHIHRVSVRENTVCVKKERKNGHMAGSQSPRVKLVSPQSMLLSVLLVQSDSGSIEVEMLCASHVSLFMS